MNTLVCVGLILSNLLLVLDKKHTILSNTDRKVDKINFNGYMRNVECSGKYLLAEE